MKAHFEIRPSFSRVPVPGDLVLWVTLEDQVVTGPGNRILNPLGEQDGDPGNVQELIYLGHWDQQPVYVGYTTSANEESLLGMRELAGLDDASFALAGRGKQLIDWQQSHRYCGRCGSVTARTRAEYAIRCVSCGASYYPRLMPCVMALVVDGDYCLLARHRRRNSWWTTLAGFIEAGENAEQAIYREVLEEVGLKPRWCRYFSSQSWPFPGQLMLGFFVGCQAGDLVLDEEELEEARWFHRESLPNVPPSFTLSGQLLEAFAGGEFVPQSEH